MENHSNNIFSKLSEYISNARHTRVAAVISYLKATGSMTADTGVVDWDTDASEEDVSLASGLDLVSLEPMGSMSRARGWQFQMESWQHLHGRG